MPVDRPVTRLLAATLLTALTFGCATSDVPEPSGSDPITVNNTSSSNTTPGKDMDTMSPNTSSPGERTEENGYVLSNCDLFAQNCADQRGSRHKCVLGNAGEGVCLRGGEERGHEEPCETIEQCATGFMCINWADARGARCERLCVPDETPSRCAVGESCTGGISTTEDYRLCLPEPTACDILSQNCSDGLACILTNHPTDGDLAQLCGQAGPQAESQQCGGDLGRCQPGMMCVRLEQGADPQCVIACRTDNPTACPQGKACTGDTSVGVNYCR